MEYQQQSYFKTPNMGGIVGDCGWYSVFYCFFLIINSGIPTAHQINIIVVVGIHVTQWLAVVKTGLLPVKLLELWLFIFIHCYQFCGEIAVGSFFEHVKIIGEI